MYDKKKTFFYKNYYIKEHGFMVGFINLEKFILGPIFYLYQLFIDKLNDRLNRLVCRLRDIWFNR